MLLGNRASLLAVSWLQSWLSGSTKAFVICFLIFEVRDEIRDKNLHILEVPLEIIAFLFKLDP